MTPLESITPLDPCLVRAVIGEQIIDMMHLVHYCRLFVKSSSLLLQ